MNVAPPKFGAAVVNNDGTLKQFFWQFLYDLWKRTGGHSDSVSQAELVGALQPFVSTPVESVVDFQPIHPAHEERIDQYGVL